MLYIEALATGAQKLYFELYLALIRSHLEKLFSPRRDINSLESAQRRVTKMIQGLRNLSNKEKLNMLTLSFKRIYLQALNEDFIGLRESISLGTCTKKGMSKYTAMGIN